jgi:hypothetical protein
MRMMEVDACRQEIERQLEAAAAAQKAAAAELQECQSQKTTVAAERMRVEAQLLEARKQNDELKQVTLFCCSVGVQCAGHCAGQA